MAPKKKANDTEHISDEDLIAHFKKELKATDIVESELDFISTGSTWLDYAIANQNDGGVPSGRIIEICGDEATGKSLLSYHIMANAQKKGGIAAYLDIERSFSVPFMSRMGVDKDKLIKPRKTPDTIEEVFEFVEKIAKLAQTKCPTKPVVVVWDSVASTMSKETVEQKYGEGRITPEARAMSDCLKRLMPTFDLGYITFVCINQLRTKVGTMWGDPNVTPHGKALPFYASVRVKVEQVGFKKLKDKDGRVIGIPTKATVFKNKVGPAHREARFNLMFDWGVDDVPSIYYYLEEKGIIEKNHGWRTYVDVNGKEHKFQDSDGTGEWRKLMKDPDFYNSVMHHLDKALVIKHIRPPETYDIDLDSALQVEQLKDDIKKKRE